jgi:hypothetical protein
MNRVKIYLILCLTVASFVPILSFGSCLATYDDAITNKIKRSSLLGVSIPLTGAGSGYVGYLSISSVTEGAIFTGLSSTTSSTLLAAGTILSSTTVIGEIITLNELKKCKQLIQQSKITYGKELIELTEEIKIRNGLVILPVEHISTIINELDKKMIFCSKKNVLPMSLNKIINLVEDRLISQYRLSENEE